MNNVLELT